MTALVIILIAENVALLLGFLVHRHGNKRLQRIRQLEDEDAAMDLANSGNDERARARYSGEADCS